MLRFGVLGLTLLLAELALFGSAGAWALDLIAEGKRGLAGTIRLPLHTGLIVLEACGLLALFCLAEGRCLSRWLDGLVAGWLAWIFRGPVFVMTMASLPGQPREAWLRVVLVWWVIYSICGFSLGWLKQRLDGGSSASEQPKGEGRVTEYLYEE